MSEISGFTFSYVQNAEMERASEAEGLKSGSGSWMMAIALALGKMADSMGERLMELASRIDSLQERQHNADDPTLKDNGKGITELNAMMQTQAQQLQMHLQAMSTIIKSIGEGNTQIARKQ